MDEARLIRYLEEVDLPEDHASAGWFVDGWTLLDAKDQLGIKLNIKVKYYSGKYRYGTAYIRKNRAGMYYHHIILNPQRTADEANKTLWHELAHALQAEAWARQHDKPITDFVDFYNSMGYNGNAYVNNPLEKHAHAVAKKNGHIKIIR